jgi:2-succinyl-5-enolpyruvyl-6-hydroxy-3-cyclohexene-1-carboxylate synthase
MIDTTHQAEYAASLVGGLADAGVDVAFISPGSRNTPLTLAFAVDPRIRDISIRDERSAGFAALGYAKATGRPAVVVCTSGSAPAHYLPAIVEANQSSTPMIVLTADRPIRLRGTGAPQTMDQVNLYGSHAKMFIDLDVADSTDAHTAAITLAAIATSSPPGVSPATIPFDDPLVPFADVPPAQEHTLVAEIDSPVDLPGNTSTDIERHLAGRKVLIVVGGLGNVALSNAVEKLADQLAAPVFADVQSNVSGANVLRNGDLVFTAHDSNRDLIAVGEHPPDIVLRLGPIPTSMPVWRWLEASGVEQILINSSRLSDPLDSATFTIDDDPVTALRAISVNRNPDNAFLSAWMQMDRAVGTALAQSLSTLPFPNEPSIARIITSSVPGDSILFVGSSRPIRDLDSFGTMRPDVTVIANRGVNGIDGAISTAAGTALTGTPTTLYIGDLTALHDISALSEVQRLGVPLRIVVVNNDGGGIFSFLPQASSPCVPVDIYERHWGTPHGLRITPIARSMGLPGRTVSTAEELSNACRAPIETPELIEIVTERTTAPGHHIAVRRAVASALARHEQVEERP